MISHLTLGSNDIDRTRRFYDGVLAPLGLSCVHDGDGAVAYALDSETAPRLWLLPPFDGLPATCGNGSHVAFMAPNRAAVDAFHVAALALGGTDEGAPGLRPHYAPDYYGAYARDPDGNKLQAVCYQAE